MAIIDAGSIDKNFIVNTTVKKEGLVYHDAKTLDVHGVYYCDGLYRRMPEDVAFSVSENTGLISRECAGGRVRFVTDSPYVAIHVTYRAVSKVPSYSNTATLGFDLYADRGYVGAFIPAKETETELESVLDTIHEGENVYTLNFPICSQIESLHIGIKEGSVLKNAPRYAVSTPIVYYGSSITQGSSASRPGTTYENIISRALNADYINLGFWGNALGEEKMAEYIAGLKMSAFVYDYDFNAPNAEHLQKTHERFFKIIRQAQPNLPIILCSAPRYYFADEHEKRLEVVKTTYENAVKAGDKNVVFLSGKEMMKDVKDVAFADSVHPTTVGFVEMAKYIGDALKKFL